MENEKTQAVTTHDAQNANAQANGQNTNAQAGTPSQDANAQADTHTQDANAQVNGQDAKAQAAPQPIDNVLVCENISKIYGKGDNITKALDNVSLNVKPGEFIGIMGPSGSGKTTLLNCISTIDTVSEGHIYVQGADITALPQKELSRFRREQLGFIFQESNMLDTMTLRENISLALTISKVDAGEITQRVEEIAATLNISDQLDRYPYEISGGQRQRAAAARAIVTNPSLVMADEPTGALDSKNARILLESLESMNQNLGATIMMVTHDSVAASYANRVLFIKDGKLFTELHKGVKERKEFFNDVLGVLAQLGGEDA